MSNCVVRSGGTGLPGGAFTYIALSIVIIFRITATIMIAVMDSDGEVFELRNDGRRFEPVDINIE